MRAHHLLLATALLAGGPAVAVEPLPGDPVAGQEFAAEVCAECHQIVGRTAMPEPGGPPAFQDVADHPATTEMALRAFLQTPHATMPHLRALMCAGSHRPMVPRRPRLVQP
jgi:mono/diheme cytochrome c family protein